MKNQLTGTVEYISEIMEIKGREKTNNKRILVITAYEDTDYPKKVALIAWNKMAEQLGSLKNDDVIDVEFKLSSREYNGKFYTEATIIDFITRKSNEEKKSGSTRTNETTKTTTQETTDKFSGEQSGDLPF